RHPPSRVANKSENHYHYWQRYPERPLTPAHLGETCHAKPPEETRDAAWRHPGGGRPGRRGPAGGRLHVLIRGGPARRGRQDHRGRRGEPVRGRDRAGRREV